MYHIIEDVEQAIKERSPLGIKPGLGRVRRLLKAVGHPEQNIHGIHVAGTNGKGSTATFLTQALLENGYNVGIFTSPSLSGLSGHIVINGEQIADQAFVKVFNDLEPAIKNLDAENEPPTTFEILTVMAFMYFSGHTDIAVIEAGMGGREDTTNVINPILSIITNVSLDHTTYLGDTLEEIATHKAGIIKKNVPVIVGKVTGSVQNIIETEAEFRQASVFQLGKAFDYEVQAGQSTEHYIWRHADTTLNVSIQMQGWHQINNSALAIMALMILKKSGYRLNWQTALQGMSGATLPGRYEVIHQTPLVIIDGAHNPGGIQALIDTVKRDYPDQTKDLLFAAFKDKDISVMLDLLVPLFDHTVLTTFEHPRAADWKDYKQIQTAKELPFVEEWETIVEHILQKKETNRIYYIAGSIHFIEKVRKHFTYR